MPRIRLCAYFLTHNSGFQHVRSLDLGVIRKCSNDYLEEQLTILEIFAQRQSLTRLWLSKFPFPSIEPGQRPKIQNMVSALASTVTDLGLYECAFASYVDMISFVRAFSHCDSLHIRDCVTGGGGSGGNMFYGLPEHVISVDALELGCTSNGSAIDVSSLIEDADLDVSQLSDLTCTGFGSAEQARSVAISTSASPIVHFQIVYTEKSGFLEGTCEDQTFNGIVPHYSFLLLMSQRFSTPWPKSGLWNPLKLNYPTERMTHICTARSRTSRPPPISKNSPYPVINSSRNVGCTSIAFLDRWTSSRGSTRLIFASRPDRDLSLASIKNQAWTQCSSGSGAGMLPCGVFVSVAYPRLCFWF